MKAVLYLIFLFLLSFDISANDEEKKKALEELRLEKLISQFKLSSQNSSELSKSDKLILKYTDLNLFKFTTVDEREPCIYKFLEDPNSSFNFCYCSKFLRDSITNENKEHYFIISEKIVSKTYCEKLTKTKPDDDYDFENAKNKILEARNNKKNQKDKMINLINDPKIKSGADEIINAFKKKAKNYIDGMNIDNFENYDCYFDDDLTEIFYGLFSDETKYVGAAYNYCLKNGITDMNYCEEKLNSKEMGYETLFLNSSLLKDEYRERCYIKWGSLNKQKLEEENKNTLYIFEGFGDEDSNQRNKNGWCYSFGKYKPGSCTNPISRGEAETRNNQYEQKRETPKKVCNTNSAGFVECFYER